MRIISGTNKGKRLVAPKKLPVRPTTDMAKEALFNILNNTFQFSQLSILDLFSGTGNIAYEFASRGSKEITAVDANYDCVKFIKKTAQELDFNISTIKSDVFKFLEKAYVKADIIFADPPYDFEENEFLKIPQIVFEKNLLNQNGQLIIEHSKHTNLSNFPNFIEARRYGGSVFSFFENVE
ncbi:RsmD family RNA methyltransferase [Salegentibacter mishustinae]|uniref:16S rRNA (Guanine(966)-N(2))-methyltransferase RsmD n=1 Tax=Salegentibacter mishustinae TaxID=270918 RepID=A0A0Q9ZBC0_9FLAO|nr:RsmD family RNA methyltransferase [Salegentibacter mishustinae]KRG30235.1 16S rRNA (guanine(966)-N(2))-methyltransferase RsmD [Salegentibacter mishustinae]MDX1719172.1 RsmD family RNA methyltransferase [Salegentibacter mishustinae]PNW19383.1 16S rRNA (guanine(966)-N(2))-methyltransferase RsmD [Salegentibacter mishustinae]PZX62172.1 16S rRNA (guanine(966)-N(2))-methyltransferase RsmD [Salegentibacter mishustinae]GGW93933.1 methyltransferase [Salegentibacter mishustinae]|tara:strand:- start:887 stop:1429 length:543 start_codon:yes stop_codon:yes gene_type:complete